MCHINVSEGNIIRINYKHAHAWQRQVIVHEQILLDIKVSLNFFK